MSLDVVSAQPNQSPALQFYSWGRNIIAKHELYRPYWAGDLAIPRGKKTLLAVGKGRSYGDSCLNDGGVLIDTSYLRRFFSFDALTGVLSAEPGATMEDVLRLSVRQGWFLPVTPGTKHVTLAGAVANDVHGKNHHCSGTFGRHVISLELLRSDGQRLLCSPTQNTELFAATIGGLGLTGIITRIELQLRKVDGPYIDMESIKFFSLEEFFSISSESDSSHEYTVAWLDCSASGSKFGRGIFMRGNHSVKPAEAAVCAPKRALLMMPFDAPSFALNPFTVRAFNTAYFHKQVAARKRCLVHYDPFFYPLDGVAGWNRIYGKRGLFQFQCVVPKSPAHAGIRRVLQMVVDSQRASFLTVIKEFGTIASPGMLSFPRPGVTVCLDFPDQGKATRKLLSDLETLTRDLGGALYPAKDACMSRQGFSQYYGKWPEFAEFIDPRFSSNFWRRVTGD